MRSGGRGWALGLLAAMALSTSCGGTGSPPPTSTGAARSPEATAVTGSPEASPPAPGATTSPALLDPFVFPDKDTPVAQLSPQLRPVWAPYNLTVIPSRHTLEGMPPIRQVRNFTQGRVGDADAQQMLAAEYRDNTFVAWAELTVQPRFENALQLNVFAGSNENRALARGEAVIDPACDLYPIAASLVPLDQQSRAYFDTNFTRKGAPVTAQYALVQTYEGPCEVDAVTPRGRITLDQIPAGGATAVFPGHLRHDPVLGDLWFTEASFLCGVKGVPTAICAAAGV